MQPKSVVLKLILTGAVLAALQSAAALASDSTNPAEGPIDVVAPGEVVNEKGEMNNVELAKNEVEDGAKNDVEDGKDAAHGGKENKQE
jgi:beta-lactam-binding protein with PASTA domain